MANCEYKSIGCTFEGTEDMLVEHMNTNANEHLLYTFKNLQKKCEERCDKLEEKLEEQKIQIVSQYEKKIDDLKMKQKHDMEQQKEEIKILTKAVKGRGEQLNMEINIARKSLSRLHTRFNTLNDIILTCPYGWVIKDFANNFQLSKQENNEILSEPFYCLNGYRGQLGVYLNGYGDEQNTHISIFFYICKGPFDEILDWPFKGIVKMSVQSRLFPTKGDKSEDIKHQFSTNDVEIIVNQKPITERNTGHGIPKFIQHELEPTGIFAFMGINKSFVDVFDIDDTINFTVDVSPL